MNSSDLNQGFDDGESIIELLDVSAATRQRHAQKRVNVDFSIWMVEQLDQEANRLGVTRQSIIKVWLAERLEQSIGPREKRSLIGCAWRPSSEWLCDDQALGRSGACVYNSSMKQLPGKTRPKWLVAAGQGMAAVVFVAMTASILPMLLIMSLVAALLLIPVLRQLRKEVEKTSVTINTPAKEEMIDITPLHNRLSQKLRRFLRRRP